MINGDLVRDTNMAVLEVIEPGLATISELADQLKDVELLPLEAES
jgi:hypothetical protein